MAHRILAVKFVVDNMLGKLARWLRILGYDVIYDPSTPLKHLVELSNNEERVFLTRRKMFPDGISVTTLYNVCSEQFSEQLRRIIHHFDLDTERFLFTRCVDCNAPVERIDKAAAQGRVPARTWMEIAVFLECPRCHTVYWEGSHRTNTVKKLQGILSQK